MHVSQMDTERVQSPDKVLKVGEVIQAKIIKIENDSGKVSLSRRQLIKEQERQTISAYMKKNKKEGSSLINMGELLGDIVLEDDLPAEAPKPAAPKPAAPQAAEPVVLPSSVPASEDPSLQSGEAPESQISVGGEESLPDAPPAEQAPENQELT